MTCQFDQCKANTMARLLCNMVENLKALHKYGSRGRQEWQKTKPAYKRPTRDRPNINHGPICKRVEEELEVKYEHQWKDWQTRYRNIEHQTIAPGLFPFERR